MNFVFDRSAQQGRIELQDADRLKLLHNMSTQDFNTMQPHTLRSTVLTTALARIIDRVLVLHRGDTALMVTNYRSTVQAWLQKHIFWNDKVRLRNVSAELGQIELYGDDAPAIMARIEASAGSMALNHMLEKADAGGAALIARIPALIGAAGYLVIAPTETLAAIQAELLRDPVVKLSTAEHYEQLRIEAGVAGPAHELTEQYIPLEAGLWESVSFNKGCYIGQEIIARMESRSKLAKTLVKLNLSQAASVGATIQHGDDLVGTLTSVTASETGYVALGFVKPSVAEVGTALVIIDVNQAAPQDAPQTRIDAHVVTAPLLQVGFTRA